MSKEKGEKQEGLVDIKKKTLWGKVGTLPVEVVWGEVHFRKREKGPLIKGVRKGARGGSEKKIVTKSRRISIKGRKWARNLRAKKRNSQKKAYLGRKSWEGTIYFSLKRQVSGGAEILGVSLGEGKRIKRGKLSPFVGKDQFPRNEGTQVKEKREPSFLFKSKERGVVAGEKKKPGEQESGGGPKKKEWESPPQGKMKRLKGKKLLFIKVDFGIKDRSF